MIARIPYDARVIQFQVAVFLPLDGVTTDSDYYHTQNDLSNLEVNFCLIEVSPRKNPYQLLLLTHHLSVSQEAD